MNRLERHSKGMTPQALSEAIFAGRILCFEELEPMRDLVALARRCIRAAFAELDPLTAHLSLGRDEYEARYSALRQAFLSDEEVVRTFEAALIAAGADNRTGYRDRLVLRVSPPGKTDYQRGFGTVPPHRDSWGSGFPSQINWWLPVYPVTAERTLAIFPAHWTRSIENDSDGWDWRRAGKDPGIPLLPTTRTEPDRSGEIRLVAEPGTLMAFSAAHLHASVANTTPYARFSCETRTLNIDDLHSGRGAPNIDGGVVPPAFCWFRRLGDGEKLTLSLDSAGKRRPG